MQKKSNRWLAAFTLALFLGGAATLRAEALHTETLPAEAEVEDDGLQAYDALSLPDTDRALVKCTAKYEATRTAKKCWKVGFKKICTNYPEFKNGRYIEFGATCDQCFAAGRDQATRSGGWTIKNEYERTCNLQ